MFSGVINADISQRIHETFFAETLAGTPGVTSEWIRERFSERIPGEVSDEVHQGIFSSGILGEIFGGISRGISERIPTEFDERITERLSQSFSGITSSQFLKNDPMKNFSKNLKKNPKIL